MPVVRNQIECCFTTFQSIYGMHLLFKGIFFRYFNRDTKCSMFTIQFFNRFMHDPCTAIELHWHQLKVKLAKKN